MALTACKDMTNTVQVTGALSFKMNAPGETFGIAGLTDQIPIAYESCGDIEVAAGQMTFAANATWLNGTNVTVRGEGKLKVAAGGTFGKHAVLRFSESGTFELPAGERQKVAECWVNGVKVEDGIYSAADLKSGDPLYGHLMGGTLQVGKLGGLLLVR